MPNKGEILLTSGKEVVYLAAPPPIVQFHSASELIEAMNSQLITKKEARQFLGFNDE